MADIDVLLSLRNVRSARNNRVVLLGPSHGANHFNTAAATGFPSSYTATSQGPINWVNAMSGGRAVLESADNFSWNGDRMDADAGYPGILSRVDAAIASNPGVIVLVAPTANDRNNMSAAWSIAGLQTAIDKITKAGVFLVIMADYPHGTATGPGNLLTGNIAAGSSRINDWELVNTWLMKQQGNGVYVVDTASVLRDAAFVDGRGIDSMYLDDGLHLNQYAAYALARVLLPLWNRLFPVFYGFPSSNHDGTTFRAVPGIDNVNPYFNGIGGQAAAGTTGNVPAGWRSVLATGINCSYTKKKTTGFNGRLYSEDGHGPVEKDWLEMTVTGNVTTQQELVLLRQDYDKQTNTPRRVMVEYEIDSGHVGLHILNIMQWQSEGGTPQIRQFGSPGPAQKFPMPPGAHRGVMRSPQFVTAGRTNRLQLNFLNMANVNINATVRVRALASGEGMV